MLPSQLLGRDASTGAAGLVGRWVLHCAPQSLCHKLEGVNPESVGKDHAVDEHIRQLGPRSCEVVIAPLKALEEFTGLDADAHGQVLRRVLLLPRVLVDELTQCILSRLLVHAHQTTNSCDGNERLGATGAIVCASGGSASR